MKYADGKAEKREMSQRETDCLWRDLTVALPVSCGCTGEKERDERCQTSTVSLPQGPKRTAYVTNLYWCEPETNHTHSKRKFNRELNEEQGKLYNPLYKYSQKRKQYHSFVLFAWQAKIIYKLYPSKQIFD